jgi:hypothetical protein
MTVGELIVELQKVDPNLPVYMNDDSSPHLNYAVEVNDFVVYKDRIVF